MSTNHESPNTKGHQTNRSLTVGEVTRLLINHYDLHEGLFELMVEFQIGGGAIGPSKKNLLPGVMIGVSKIGLNKVDKSGPNTIDAAEVNPAPRRKRSGSSGSKEG